MIELLLEPFQHGFMQRAFAITLIVAIPAALLSCYLVLKGWALMGDAISHAVLPGVVIAYIIGLPFAVGAFIAGLFCAITTGYLAENSRVKRDTVMGVVFSGMFALGLVLYTNIQTDIHLDQILFGDMLGISSSDIYSTTIISLVVIAFIALRWRDLLLQAFDNQHAKATGLSVKFLHYALLIMISLIVVAALKAVGIILAIAFLITPGAIAFMMVKKFETMLLLSTIIGVSAAFLGIYFSFFLDSAPAPTIVLVMAAFFILVFSFNSWKNSNTTASTH